MSVPPRQPYAGELVFTAFSGSHQDAIKKGLNEWNINKLIFDELIKKHADDRSAISKLADTDFQPKFWDVPYLTIDPTDIGREYREVIRVNSQSGKGGVAYLLESEFGIELPKDMQREFGPIANDEVDKLGREVSGAELKAMFWKEYVERNSPWNCKRFDHKKEGAETTCIADIGFGDVYERGIEGTGNGPLSAFVHALRKYSLTPVPNFVVPKFEIADYREHALSSGEEAAAIAYIQIKTADGKTRWGAGVDTNIELASVRAVLSALNRLP
jgi:2-isopropylmalate synthase